MYFSDREEWLVILAASVIIIGLLVKTYRDYKSMTFDMNKKVAKQEEDEAYVRKLKKVVDEKNQQLKKVIEQKNKAKK